MTHDHQPAASPRSSGPPCGDDPIYLDHNATTPVLPRVVEAMLPHLREHFGNPSSAHVYGRRAQAAVQQARQQVANLLACDADEVLFTSGGTESNNIAIRGALAASRRRGLVTTVVEHPATTRPCLHLEQQGCPVTWIPVDRSCMVETEPLTEALDSRTALVTVMHANNETGTIQPLAQIAAAARSHGVLLHSDAAQSVGKVRTRVDELGVDLLSVAGHKLYAPKGVGALYVRRKTPLRPVLLGAGHEQGLRPGTENVAFIAGLGCACELAHQGLEAEQSRIRQLRDQLWALLQAEVPQLRLNGHPKQRLPNTLNVRFPGVSGDTLLAAPPRVAASTGSACHEGGALPSKVLGAMGLEPDEALGAVRLSLGRGTTTAHVEQAATALVEAYRAVR